MPLAILQHSPDDAAQITLMAALLPDLALYQSEAAALLVLHRLRFPARDVARLGRDAIIRAAVERRIAFALPAAILATMPAASPGLAPADIDSFLPTAMSWARQARDVRVKRGGPSHA